MLHYQFVFPASKHFLLPAIFIACVATGLPDTMGRQSNPASIERSEIDKDWVKQIAPGVRLIGRKPAFAELGRVDSVMALPDGKRMLVGGERGLSVCDLENERVIDQWQIPDGHSQWLVASPDKQRFVWSNNFESSDSDDPESGDLSVYRGKKLERVELNCLDSDLQETGSLVLGPDDFLEGIVTPILKISFSPDGKLIGVLIQNRQIVADAVSGKIMRVFQHDEWVSGCVFSRDNRQLILMAKLPVAFDLASGDRNPNSELAGNLNFGNPFFCFTSPDGDSVIVKTRDGLVQVDSQTGMKVRSIGGDKPLNAFGAQFSADGNVMCTVMNQPNSGDPKVYGVFWNVADGKELGRVKLDQMTWNFDCSADGKSILLPNVGALGIRQAQWSAADDPAVPAELEFLPASIDVKFNTNGNRIAMASVFKLRLIDVDDGAVDIVESGVQKLRASQVSNRFAGINQPNWLRCSIEEVNCDSLESKTRAVVEGSKEVDTVKAILAVGGASDTEFMLVYPEFALDSVFSPDDKQVLGLFHRCKQGIMLRIWSDDHTPKTNLLVSMERLPLGSTISASLIMLGRIAPDGTWVAYIQNGEVFLISTKTKEELHKFSAPAGAHKLAISGDGKLLAVAGAKQIEVWNPETGEFLKVLDGELAHVAFSARSSRMLIAPSGGEAPARVIDTESWKTVREYGSKAGDRNSADISADGRQVVIGLADGRLEHWRLESMD